MTMLFVGLTGNDNIGSSDTCVVTCGSGSFACPTGGDLEGSSLCLPVGVVMLSFVDCCSVIFGRVEVWLCVQLWLDVMSYVS